MLVYFSLIALILAVIIFNYGVKYFTGNIFLGLFFIFLGVFAFYFESVYFVNTEWIAVFTLGFFNPFLYLMGPAYYLSTRMMTTGSTRYYKWDIIHIIPLSIMVIASLPYFFSSYDFKLETLRYLRTHTDELPPNTMSFIPQSAQLFGQAILLITYSIWARITFVRNKIIIEKKEYHLNIPSVKIIKWMNNQTIMTILFFTLYAMVIIIGFTDQKHSTWEYLSFFRLLVKLIAFTFSILLFFTPSVLYGFPKRMMENYNIVKPADCKQELLLFTKDYIKTIESRIIDLVQEEKFIDDNFNRTNIAKQIQIPSHHLDYYFKNILKVKFTEWRNELRIEYTAKLIQNGMLNKLTLERIAEMSGYRNYSTFHAAFQKYMQTTPAKYATKTSVKSKDFL